jgi:hypothetical protein
VSDSDPSDAFAEFIARTRLPAAPLAGPCPDAGLVAGFAEGRLAGREADAVAAHLVACEPCREVVASFAQDAGAPQPAVAPARTPVRRLRPLAFAAAAAAIFVAALVVAARRDAASQSTGEALVASARDLAAARPDLFAGFEPVRAGETLESAPGPMRGALALFSPAGKVLETSPSFRWETVAGVVKWRIDLRAAAGDTIWTAETAETTLRYPEAREALRPGTRYIWEASGDGPLGAEAAGRAFDVASDAERASFEEASRVVADRVPERLRPLVLAHVALRRGLYAAAGAEAGRFLQMAPGDSVGLETLAAARGALGEIDDIGAKR